MTKALATFAQIKKRKSFGLDDDKALISSKESQSAGTDALIYLREKYENDRKLRGGIRIEKAKSRVA